MHQGSNIDQVAMIVEQFKSRGFFDEFRREALSEIETKPFYYNLSLQVEDFVTKFLEKKCWTSTLNKNDFRNQLRNEVLKSNNLNDSVDFIVTQTISIKMHDQISLQILEYLEKFFVEENKVPKFQFYTASALENMAKEEVMPPPNFVIDSRATLNLMPQLPPTFLLTTEHSANPPPLPPLPPPETDPPLPPPAPLSPQHPPPGNALQAMDLIKNKLAQLLTNAADLNLSGLELVLGSADQLIDDDPDPVLSTPAPPPPLPSCPSEGEAYSGLTITQPPLPPSPSSIQLPAESGKSSVGKKEGPKAVSKGKNDQDNLSVSSVHTSDLSSFDDQISISSSDLPEISDDEDMKPMNVKTQPVECKPTPEKSFLGLSRSRIQESNIGDTAMHHTYHFLLGGSGCISTNPCFKYYLDLLTLTDFKNGAVRALVKTTHNQPNSRVKGLKTPPSPPPTERGVDEAGSNRGSKIKKLDSSLNKYDKFLSDMYDRRHDSLEKLTERCLDRKRTGPPQPGQASFEKVDKLHRARTRDLGSVTTSSTCSSRPKPRDNVRSSHPYEPQPMSPHKFEQKQRAIADLEMSPSKKSGLNSSKFKRISPQTSYDRMFGSKPLAPKGSTSRELGKKGHVLPTQRVRQHLLKHSRMQMNMYKASEEQRALEQDDSIEGKMRISTSPPLDYAEPARYGAKRCHSPGPTPLRYNYNRASVAANGPHGMNYLERVKKRRDEYYEDNEELGPNPSRLSYASSSVEVDPGLASRERKLPDQYRVGGHNISKQSQLYNERDITRRRRLTSSQSQLSTDSDDTKIKARSKNSSGEICDKPSSDFLDKRRSACQRFAERNKHDEYKDSGTLSRGVGAGLDEREGMGDVYPYHKHPTDRGDWGLTRVRSEHCRDEPAPQHPYGPPPYAAGYEGRIHREMYEEREYRAAAAAYHRHRLSAGGPSVSIPRQPSSPRSYGLAPQPPPPPPYDYYPHPGVERDGGPPIYGPPAGERGDGDYVRRPYRTGPPLHEDAAAYYQRLPPSGRRKIMSPPGDDAAFPSKYYE